VKGYRLIDPSTDHLIIEDNVQFKESIPHAPQELHADNFVLPPVKDDEHGHADSSLNESSNSEDSNDSNIDLVQSDADLVHVDANADLKPRPKWAKTTL
jgi:hypothetical protein